MALPIPDVTDIVQGGQNRVKVFSKEVTQAPSGTVAFADSDLVTYLSDVGEAGASRDSQTISLFHLKQDAKLPGNSNIKDLQITEALTTAQIAVRKGQYEDGDFIVFGFFDENGAQLYGCLGFISDWGMTLSNGDVCTLTYTLSLSQDDIVCTMPSTTP
jgi:hypothetical protein